LHAGVDVLRNSPQFIPSALDLHIAHGLPFHDVRIVQAALDSGRRRLCSDGLQLDRMPGQRVVANPFKTAGGSSS